MKTVYLAEKPSQAADIAKVLGVKRRGEGFIEVASGDIVTHARGHFYELAEPQEYREDWGGRWAWAQLPLTPTDWKYNAVRGAGAQLKVIREHLKTAQRCVIATDAGREGELIARLILREAKFKGTIERFWASSLTEKDIKAALNALLPGESKVPLYEAALARQHMDWAWGLSLTRAATLAANVRGDYFPVGRVKTPTLAMVVRRHLEIVNFVPQTYYELEATVATGSGDRFKMTHAPAAEARITSEAKAKELLAQASGALGQLEVTKSAEKEGAPLPFSLPKLQQAANKSFGFSAARTLELAQELYEKYKVASYPRTDCQHLAESQKADIPALLDAVEASFPAGVASAKAAGITLRASTFDDSKLTDHHGIIPTVVSAEVPGDAGKLYSLICLRFLQAISSDHLYDSTKVRLDANGVPFSATGKAVTKPGWRGVKLS